MNLKITRVVLALLTMLTLANPAAAQDSPPTKDQFLDLRSYTVNGQASQLLHLGVIWKNEEMTNLYLVKDTQGLALAQANHLFPLGEGWRLGPAIITKRGGQTNLGAVVDYQHALAGGTFYGWVQLQPALTGRCPNQVIIDPLEITWPVTSSITAGVRGTFVLTDGQKPYVGVGPAIAAKLGRDTMVDIHYYPGPREFRIQLIQHF